MLLLDRKIHRPRPLIGITTDYVPKGRSPGAFMRLHIGYSECVFAAGGLPILIPPILKEQDLDELLDRMDGIIMSGCAFDLEPKKLGVPAHREVQPMPEFKEIFDRMVCQRAVDRQIPMLTVGVSTLLLNVLCGGTIHTFLPEDCPKSLPHRDPGGGVHRHEVTFEPGTRIAQIYDTEDSLVNSFHRQALDEIADSFRVGATAPDGVVEAIEAVDADWFCMGVQWHPHSDSASALDMQLFDALLEAARVKPELRLYQKAA